MPLIAFVTAYDEYAVRAFEVNAVDYLLKPVEKARLRETLNRAQERIEHAEIVAEQASHVGAAIDAYEALAQAAVPRADSSSPSRRSHHRARPSDRIDRGGRRTASHHDRAKRAPHDHVPPEGSRTSPRSRAIYPAGSWHVGQCGPDHEGQRDAGRDACRDPEQRSEASSQPSAVSHAPRPIPQTLDASTRCSIPTIRVYVLPAHWEGHAPTWRMSIVCAASPCPPYGNRYPAPALISPDTGLRGFIAGHVSACGVSSGTRTPPLSSGSS